MKVIKNALRWRKFKAGNQRITNFETFELAVLNR